MPRHWPLPAAKRAIIAAGCLAMAYTQLTTSPATVQFARSLGGNGLHIGILGALPVGLICMQLAAALAARRFARRKPLWFAVGIVQRLVFVPAALGPWLWPQAPGSVWIWLLVALTALNQGLLHFGGPLWLSWMGDYLPHRDLGEFWGKRHSGMQWTAAAALLVNALLFAGQNVDVRASFAAIIVLGSALGLVDILLHLKVEEPPPKRGPQPKLRTVLAGPFRHRQFRSFILYSCYWNVASMVGAPFISMFLLDYVGMHVFDVLLLWTISWVGGAVLSSRLGRWADRFGQRPLLVLCTAFKSLNMIALFCCPPNPQLAFWLLAPAFMIDAFFNAGIVIANNGFMLKNSPRENRTVFVAAGTAYAGLVGGITSVLAGAALAASEGWSLQLAGIHLVNFHVLFAVSIALRLGGAVLARRVSEPSSAGARYVFGELILAARTRVRAIAAAVPRRHDERHTTLGRPTHRRTPDPAELLRGTDPR